MPTSTSGQAAEVYVDPPPGATTAQAVQVRTLRFALGVTVCVAVAFALRWPLFHLAPILTAFFLAIPTPVHAGDETWRLSAAAIVAVLLGLVFSHLLLPYPLVYLTLLGLTLFHLYYWVNRGVAPTHALLPLVTVIVLPMLSTGQQTLAYGFMLSFYFAVSATLSISIFLIAHAVMPDSDLRGNPPTDTRVHDYSKPAAAAALKSTIVVLPATVLFLHMNWASEVLVVVFVGILCLSSETSHGQQHGSKLVKANLIGVCLAVVFYLLIIAVPKYEFFVVLTFVTMLAFGERIFSRSPLAVYMPAASIALLALIGSSMTAHAHFADKPLTRVLYIGLAALYVIVALMALDRVWPSTNDG